MSRMCTSYVLSQLFPRMGLSITMFLSGKITVQGRWEGWGELGTVLFLWGSCLLGWWIALLYLFKNALSDGDAMPGLQSHTHTAVPTVLALLPATLRFGGGVFILISSSSLVSWLCGAELSGTAGCFPPPVRILNGWSWKQTASPKQPVLPHAVISFFFFSFKIKVLKYSVEDLHLSISCMWTSCCKWEQFPIHCTLMPPVYHRKGIKEFYVGEVALAI